MAWSRSSCRAAGQKRILEHEHAEARGFCSGRPFADRFPRWRRRIAVWSAVKLRDESDSHASNLAAEALQARSRQHMWSGIGAWLTGGTPLTGSIPVARTRLFALSGLSRIGRGNSNLDGKVVGALLARCVRLRLTTARC